MNVLSLRSDMRFLGGVGGHGVYKW